MAPRSREVKKSQRESFLLHEIADLFLKVTLDDKELHNFYVTRVELSPDGGLCTVFFHTARGEGIFEEQKKKLILYKPSMRAAIARASHSRYAPDLKFVYDQGVDKHHKMEDLFNRLKAEGKL